MRISKGGMQSSGTTGYYCPICGKSFFRGVELSDQHRHSGLNVPLINVYNHWTKSGKVLYCDNQGNKRKAKIHDEFWKIYYANRWK